MTAETKRGYVIFAGREDIDGEQKFIAKVHYPDGPPPELSNRIIWDAIPVEIRSEVEARMLKTRARESEAKADELERIFDLQWDASRRATKRWQEAHPGNDHVWPDAANLCVWLMDRITALEAENAGDIAQKGAA